MNHVWTGSDIATSSEYDRLRQQVADARDGEQRARNELDVALDLYERDIELLEKELDQRRQYIAGVADVVLRWRQALERGITLAQNGAPHADIAHVLEDAFEPDPADDMGCPI
jgi:hypothetical protein